MVNENSTQKVKDALYKVLERTTFYEDAVTLIKDLKHPKERGGAIQRKIWDNYTNAIPNTLKQVSMSKHNVILRETIFYYVHIKTMFQKVGGN